MAEDAYAKDRMQLQWDGRATSFPAYERRAKHFLMMKDLAWVLDDLRQATGIDPPNGQNKKKGETKAYAYLAESISNPDKLISMIAKYDDKYGREAVDQLQGNPDADAIQAARVAVCVGFQPQRLWDAICNAAKGPIKDMSGKDIYSEMRSLKFDEDGSYKERVERYIQKLRNILGRAQNINDPNYVITEAVLCEQFIDDMPRRFKKLKPAYRDIRSIHDLEDQANLDARDFDKDADEDHDLKAMTAMTDKDNQIAQMAQSLTQLQQVVEKLASGGKFQANSNRKERYPTKAARMDPNTNSVGGDLFCVMHGWGKHGNRDCRSQKGKANTDSKKITLVKNDDETYSLMTNVHGAMVTIQAFAQTGENIANRIFVDCACEEGISNNIDQLTQVTKLNPSSAPLIEGTNDGEPVRATHRGLRTIEVQDGVYIREWVLYSAHFKYNLSATSSIALSGISTLHDASDPQRRLFLVPNKKHELCGARIPCQPVGKIWVLPESAKIVHSTAAEPAVKFNEPKAFAASNLSQSTSRCDYGLFRRMLGAVSHDETMRVAKTMDVDLRNIKADEQHINVLGRVANQAKRPLKRVDKPAHDPHGSSIHIGSDTVGNHLPTSARGNKVLQTFSILSAHGYRAYAGKDKTADATWQRFKRFCMDEGLHMAHEAVSQPIVFHSDQGGEYTGKGFATPLQKAGIKHVTSTAYKSDGKLESPNNLVQQRMRANLAIGRANFASFGFDERKYWDFAAEFGSLQDSTRTAALRGDLTLAQMSRELGTHFGGFGTVTLDAHSPYVKDVNKQLRNRATKAVYLGKQDGKFVMLLNNGKCFHTIDVVFDNTSLHVQAPQEGGDRYVAFGDDVPHSIPAAQESPPTAGVTVAEETHMSFLDGNGDTITAGDKVLVLFEDPGNPTYEGTVVNIDTNDGTFTVHYDDGDELTHDLDTDSGSVFISLKTRTYAPHHSVKRFLNAQGNIKEEYLIGAREFPPTPPKPNYTRANAPPDPTSLAHAFSTQEAIWWVEATINEYRRHTAPLRRQPTFHNTTATANMSTIWVLTTKFAGLRLDKFKARLCANGAKRVRGEHYEESYVSGAPPSDLRALEAMALAYSWLTFEIDLEQAYCWVKRPKAPNGEEVILRPVVGTQMFNDSGQLLNQQLDMALYGLPESGWALAKALATLITSRGERPCPIVFLQCESQPVIFGMTDDKWPNDVFIVNIFNDNIRSYTSNAAIQKIFRGWLATEFSITGGETPLRDLPPQPVLGMMLEYHPTYVKFSMEGFCRKAIAKAGMTNASPSPTPMIPGFTLSKTDIPDLGEQDAVMAKVNTGFRKTFTTFEQVTNFYRSLVSALGWLAKQCAPILSLPVSILGRVMHCPPWKAFAAVKRVYKYLVGRPDIGITYRKTRDYDWRNGDFLEFEFQCDASFADDDATRRSQCGYVGGPKGMAVTTYASNQLKKVTTSTKHAESASAFPACKEIVYTTNVQNFMRLKFPGAITLFMDNAATVLDCGAPIRKFSPASKHFDIEDKFVVQCAEDDIINVVHKPGTIDCDNSNPQPGDGFCADSMTKPLPKILHDVYFAEMHGVSVSRSLS
ncbi:MAG: hypothetical protein COB29_16075 [Sulfitobacter sp.]|nr:MAG: hypothetical protein COB29_16075 [Sulfitobacter sp.]